MDAVRGAERTKLVPSMIPIWLDLRGKKAVVFGAGRVGLRKANYLAAEAEVTVIGMRFEAGLDTRATAVRADIREVMDEWMDRADLVVAATDDRELNDRIAEEAMRRGTYCNRADGISTFLIPSVVERERFKVAVSTEGRSPGMSKYLGQEIDRLLGPSYDLMVRLQEELRGEAKEHIKDQRLRERYLWAVMEDRRVWELLASDYGGAKRVAMERLMDHD